MTTEELKKEIEEIIKEVRLNSRNKVFLELIKSPIDFEKSEPGEYKPADYKNEGETKWQRKLYNEESNIWLDLELPIGQYPSTSSGRRISKRVDLIGKKGGKYILCELKKTKKGEAGQPFDALLQLLAYYFIIKNNCEKLDGQHPRPIHHTNAHDKSWKWTDLANNPILLLRANEDYWKNWKNWEKKTKKNDAAKKIIKSCRKMGIDIKFADEKKEIKCE